MRSKTGRFWLGVLFSAVVVVCVLQLTRTTRSAKAGSVTEQSASEAIQSPAAPPETFDGILTDTRLRSKTLRQGRPVSRRLHPIHNGEHFALVDGDKTYVLDGDSLLLKRLAGERVTIAGNLNRNTIAVVSVVEANPKSE